MEQALKKTKENQYRRGSEMSALPEPSFYTLKTLAKRWNCIEDQILNYVLTGQLKASVLTQGWWMEKGYFEKPDDDNWFRIPENIYTSYDEILDLTLRSVRQILNGNERDDPDFETPKDEYLCFSGQHYPSDVYPEAPSLKPSDLIFRLKQVKKFEGSVTNDKISNFVNIPDKRKTLKQLELEMCADAMPVWEKYYNKHKTEPTRIETAELLIRSYSQKYGHHNVNSIIRHLKLNQLKTEFARYKTRNDEEGKRILS
ncbi:MAG: hypothetical protein H6863_06465 [Rhodospirillales bacterium]|nr:hypothetical protein [Rhodospirillales bacterium]MCB9994867.1 hypothetical protein [Rhodospirillales bacterium]